MAQVIIRNLDDAVVTALKSRAAARRHSLEQELRLLLTEAARPSRSQARETAAAVRELGTGPVTIDLERLIREDRDR